MTTTKPLSPEVQAMIRRYPHLRERLEANPPPLRPKPKPPEPVTTVKVGPDDPNWTKANQGRISVEVYEPTPEQVRKSEARLRAIQNEYRPLMAGGQRDLNEELYRQAADREFNRPQRHRRPALVVTDYNPIQRFRAEEYGDDD